MIIITKIYKILRGRDIKFSKSVSVSVILNTSIQWVNMLVRGFLKTRKIIFIDSGVIIRNKKHITLSKGVRVGRLTELDGYGISGLHVGNSTSIGAFSLIKVSSNLSNPGNYVRIGNNVGIGDFSHIGGGGGVSIGDNTITGAYLSIHPENHIFSVNPLIRESDVTRIGVSVGENNWIGAKVTILDGSKIGNNCIIAAGCVVKGIYPDNCLIGGVPSRIIKRIEI